MNGSKNQREKEAIKSFHKVLNNSPPNYCVITLKKAGWKELWPWVFVNDNFPDVKIDWAPGMGKRIRATTSENLEGIVEDI